MDLKTTILLTLLSVIHSEGTNFVPDPQLYFMSNEVIISFWNVHCHQLCLGYLIKPDWVLTNTACANRITLPYSGIGILPGIYYGKYNVGFIVGGKQRITHTSQHWYIILTERLKIHPKLPIVYYPSRQYRPLTNLMMIGWNQAGIIMDPVTKIWMTSYVVVDTFNTTIDIKNYPEGSLLLDNGKVIGFGLGDITIPPRPRGLVRTTILYTIITEEDFSILQSLLSIHNSREATI